jgi:hypothetical protein
MGSGRKDWNGDYDEDMKHGVQQGNKENNGVWDL